MHIYIYLYTYAYTYLFIYLHIYIYIGREREQASMRLGPVGTEGLLASSRFEDETKILPKPS